MEDAKGSWLGLILIWIWSQVFNIPNFGSISILKVLFRILEVPDLALVFYHDLNVVTGLWYTGDPNFVSLSWFWQCREHPCPLSPNLGLGGCWRFLNEVLLLHNYLHIIIGLWYTNVPNFCYISWIWRCKEHPYLLSPDLRLWRRLEAPDWSLASWAWIWEIVTVLWHTHVPNFGSILILKVQRISIYFQLWFGDWEDAESSWLGFGI